MLPQFVQCCRPIFQTCVGQSSSKCEEVGPRCDDSCENIQYCPYKGADPITVANCSSTKHFCGYDEGANAYQCTSDSCDSPNGHPFKCIQQGILPSPYKCDTYYICTKLDGPPELECTCDEGEIFNTQIHQCSEDACPEDRPVKCKTPGQTGVIDGYCFICNEYLDANVYRCGFKNLSPMWSPRAQKCGPYTGPPLPGGNGTTSSPSVPTEPTPNLPTPETPPSPAPSCVQEGQHLPNPLDCHSYFFCDKDLIPQPRTCPMKYIYDQIRKSCVLGVC